MPDRDDIEITIPEQEGWDNVKEEFVQIKETKIRMKHSLLSISKWEMKWKKPFLSPGYQMTDEELTDYFKCMTITQNVDPCAYDFISAKDKDRIVEYINTPLSAYPHRDNKKKGTQPAIVSERIYYWMAHHNIPSSYEKWHLSRLLNLLDIAAKDNEPPEKVSTAEAIRQRRELNLARRKAWNTRG